MTNIDQHNTYAHVHACLTSTMPGFSNLLDAVQGMMVGSAIAQGILWTTPDIQTTHHVVRSELASLNSAITAFGIEA